jgi:hypothetical protein
MADTDVPRLRGNRLARRAQRVEPGAEGPRRKSHSGRHLERLRTRPGLLNRSDELVLVGSVLNKIDHKRAPTGIFDRSADMINSAISDNEAVVKIRGVADFDGEVRILFLERSELYREVWGKILGYR